MKKILIFVVVVGMIFGAFALVKFARTIGFTENYAPKQPIKFSHRVHAGDAQIQCQYCHFASEQGRHAGIPPTELCMNCHTKIKKDSPEILKVKEALDSGKNIQWQKVHHLPDFAYFNHSQHVSVGKVACQKCHGEVQTLDVMKQTGDLSMGWCIRCHRENEIAPPNDHKSKAGGDCARCHY